MDSYPQVICIIVNWNGKAQTIACLEALGAVRYPKERLRIILVDNGSEDGSVEAVRASHPGAEILANPANIGYSAAVNEAIRTTRVGPTDWIWVLNNDVVVHPQSLARMIEVGCTDPSIGVVGPMIYEPDRQDRIAFAGSGYGINLWTGHMKKLRVGKDVFTAPEEKTADVDSILGCANLIRASILDGVGLLEPAFNVYFEETDFNTRVRKAGFRVVLVRDAGVVHVEAATMNRRILKRAWFLLRNLVIFELRNAAPRQLVTFFLYYFFIHLPHFFLRGGLYGISVKRREMLERRSRTTSMRYEAGSGE